MLTRARVPPGARRLGPDRARRAPWCAISTRGRAPAANSSRMGMIMGVVPAIAPVLGGVAAVAFGWRSTLRRRCSPSASRSRRSWPCACPRRSATRSPEPHLVRVDPPRLRHAAAPSLLSRLRELISVLTYGGLFAFISGSSFVLHGIYGLGQIAVSASPSPSWCSASSSARSSPSGSWDGAASTEPSRLGVACLAAGGLLMLLLVRAGLADLACRDRVPMTL